MIRRYSHPQMARIWSEERRFETWLRVEIAAAEVMADAGIVPDEAARDIRERGGFDIARIDEIEQTTQHDLIAFTTAVAERVGPVCALAALRPDVIGRRGHGACPADGRGLRPDAREARRPRSQAIRRRAFEHRATPMIGRTHGVHAEPMTFGLKLALWYAEIQRSIERVTAARETVRVGKVSGAVGHVRPPRPGHRSAHLRDARARRRARVVADDPARPACHLDVRAGQSYAASLEKFALEVRGLQKTEIGEVEEPFGKGQKGSSAMPHKRNPIGCEQVCGLARLVRANAMAALENVALWHERDISHSSVERVILPDSFLALDHMLRRFTRIVDGLVVNADRMRENLERSRGVVFSGTVLLELARRGVSREQAYSWVQRNAMRSHHEAAGLPRTAARRTPTSPRCCRPRKSSAPSTFVTSCGTWTASSTACSSGKRDRRRVTCRRRAGRRLRDGGQDAAARTQQLLGHRTVVC